MGVKHSSTSTDKVGRRILRFLLVFAVLVFIVLFLFILWLWFCAGQENQDTYHYHQVPIQEGVCDKKRNAGRPFCDSSLSIDDRVRSLLSSLTLDEKIGLMTHAAKGASAHIDLDPYTWWNEALHGVAWSPGVHFRPPTEHSTSFPQIINLASSFNKQLFLKVGNATGNEARAFFNAGNAGLTFWSPNINIYRDPRWGRGHETPGEDPHLNREYARAFIRGMQGQGQGNRGFLKTSACCKHFTAYSLETGRYSFNALVTKQDLADTYLPVFKSCVKEANVSCIMCAYNAVNGIPACADKNFLTNVVRNDWGFDGYIISDCGAVSLVQAGHYYTNTTSNTCRAVLDAGLDLECGEFFVSHLRAALGDGTVPEEMVNAALFRSFRVLMRLGYFEKNDTRPFKELNPSIADSQQHRQLALEAARQSIVLLKNEPNPMTREPVLPIDPEEKWSKSFSLGLIGPFLNASRTFLGNYFGNPSYIKTPLEEIQKYLPDLQWEFGCDVTSFNKSRLQAAENLARSSEQVIIFVGINPYEVEYEDHDRINLTLPGLQNELIRRILAVAQQPVILFLVSGGAVDLEEWANDPRVGAIIWAGYLGQSAGEAITDVLFGVHNPAGRLPQTFYANEFTNQVEMGDMSMRPGPASMNKEGSGSPGRTYRFYTGVPIYPFGHGLSYTSFEYSFIDDDTDTDKIRVYVHAFHDGGDCAVRLNLTVRNAGHLRAGDHSVLWFLAPPNAGQGGRPIKSLVEFERLTQMQPLKSRRIQLCLPGKKFQLANEHGDFKVVPGEWKLIVGNLERIILVL